MITNTDTKMDTVTDTDNATPFGNTLLYAGKICPYCECKTEYVDSAVVYGRSYGMIYLCRKCDAYVGVHKGTSNALGRLANAELRHWKKEAHKYFDALWQKKMTKGFTKHEARGGAYKWLSKEMGLHIDLTHIGMMDVEQCKRVVELCGAWA